MFIKLTRSGDLKEVRVNMNYIAEYIGITKHDAVYTLLTYECGGVELEVIQTPEQIDKLIMRANTTVIY